MLVLATVFWGLSFPLIKALALVGANALPSASSGFAVAMLVAPRFLLAVPVIAACLALQRRREPRPGPWIRRAEAKQGVVVGLFAAIGLVLQNDGLRYTAASTSAFLTQFYAITIPLWVAFRRRTPPRAVVIVSTLLVMAGVAILGRFDWRNLRLGRGEIETLLASLFFMGQILWLEHPGFSSNRPLPMTLVMFLLPAVVFFAWAAAAAPASPALPALLAQPFWILGSITLCLACTVAPYVIMNVWQPKITATEAGLVYCCEPIFATLLSLFVPALFSFSARIAYPNEHAGVHLLVGGGLITIANGLLQAKGTQR